MDSQTNAEQFCGILSHSKGTTFPSLQESVWVPNQAHADPPRPENQKFKM